MWTFQFMNELNSFYWLLNIWKAASLFLNVKFSLNLKATILNLVYIAPSKTELKHVIYLMVKCDFDIGWTESFVVVYGCTDYPFVDFKKNLKIRKEKGPQFYKMATILTNCHTFFVRQSG